MNQQLKSQLEQIKDKEGQNLYNHICNLFSKLALDDPKNSYDVFEDYSQNIKLSKYDFKKHNDFQDNTERIREKYAEVAENFQALKKLLDISFGFNLVKTPNIQR